ncbi:thiol-disulfide oxidoreductase DCC family protein [Halobacteria archaeon AArc-dxtr1]|nr:thiol-disulfide oxidoreductase DCC family protein [Halobacteria archaeon AArc-dxtr1]
MAEDVSAEHPVVLFDGVCNLCTGSVQFLIERDPEGVFRFAPLQSSVAEELLEDTDVDPDDLDSVVVIDDGRVYEKSDAVLRVAAYLGGIYRLLPPFRFLPTRLRNLVYDFVAARRYGWFGKKDQCMMPTPELQSRFLAGGPGPDSSEVQET